MVHRTLSRVFIIIFGLCVFLTSSRHIVADENPILDLIPTEEELETYVVPIQLSDFISGEVRKEKEGGVTLLFEGGITDNRDTPPSLKEAPDLPGHPSSSNIYAVRTIPLPGIPREIELTMCFECVEGAVDVLLQAGCGKKLIVSGSLLPAGTRLTYRYSIPQGDLSESDKKEASLDPLLSLTGFRVRTTDTTKRDCPSGLTITRCTVLSVVPD